MKSILKGACSVAALMVAVPAFAGESVDSDFVETIIVTATRDPNEPPVIAENRARLSRTPGSVAIVASEAYEKRTAQGFSDMLQGVPGVMAQKRYGEESRLSIRGSGIGQSYHQRGVMFAQDGVPFADADGFSDFQKIDPLSARFIEVYKGGNALRFGGAQLGGAINLVTPTGYTAESDYMLRLEGGSFDTQRISAAVAKVMGNWDVYASVNAMQADGFREYAEQDQVRGTLNLGYRFGEEREVRLIVYGADINQQVPGTLDLDTALTTPELSTDTVKAGKWARDQEIGRVSLQTHWRLNGNLVFEGGIYATTTDLHHPISIVIDQQADNQGAFGRFDWAGTLLGHKADLFWGVSYRQGQLDQQLYGNNAGENGFQFGDSRQKATALDVFSEGRFFVTDSLAFVAGASYGRATRDYVNNLASVNNAEKTFDWFAPRVGLLWQSETGTQVYANVTRSVEPPHFGALVQAPYPGFVPNKPQEAVTAEVGTRGRVNALTWDITLYQAWLQHELLSFSNTFGLPSAVAGAEDTTHKGLEAAFNWQVASEGVADGSLAVQTSYTYSDFKFDGDILYGDNQIPVVPKHQIRLGLNYEHASGLFLSPQLEWRPADVYVDYANTLKAPGYAIVSVNTGWEMENGITLFVDARNLFDKAYVPEFGAITDASAVAANTAVFYPGEGRSVYAGVLYRF
ncbi:TonB-dependent receptor family protein [Kordiimonas pumila]|uniref:TonB-dependent receptor family protein n=1 Tax=Kordiimonas pumila TaxID=2161677 RepID=A0ABV7D1Y8_9PROT|nr:TonB-dependent receptor [Kordiimonas pumila]